MDADTLLKSNGLPKRMVDTVSKAVRSRIMSRIRGKDTKPELLFAKYLRSKGIKYRRNVRIQGHRVDFRLVGTKTVVFVHGCFWHGCPSCFRLPKSNRTFWSRKIELNKRRDFRLSSLLRKQGWLVRTVWEHAGRPGHRKIFIRSLKRAKQ